MADKQQTSKEYFTLLTIIHTALLTAQTAFAAISYYLISSGQFAISPDLKSILQIIAPVIVVVGLVASYMVTKNQLAQVKQKPTLSEKLSAYRATLIIKWALLEMPSVFSIVCYLLTGSMVFLLLAAIIIVSFFINRPSAYATSVDLELNAAQKQILENPDGTIS